MYHHTVMPMISWGATKYYPGGHGTFIGESIKSGNSPLLKIHQEDSQRRV